MNNEKLNLYQKLVEIRKSVVYMQKDAQGYSYKYATEGAILEKIRPHMDRLGVVLEVDMPEITEMKEGHIRATLRFVWVDADNPQSRIEKTIVFMDSGEATKKDPLRITYDVKKCGGLLTYGVKYFLYKFFNVEIGTDPDQEQSEPIESIPPKDADGILVTKEQAIMLANLGALNPNVAANILKAQSMTGWVELEGKRVKEGLFNSMVNALKGGKK